MRAGWGKVLFEGASAAVDSARRRLPDPLAVEALRRAAQRLWFGMVVLALGV